MGADSTGRFLDENLPTQRESLVSTGEVYVLPVKA
jgi:hypothetical protein